jgi:hypothetical protein
MKKRQSLGRSLGAQEQPKYMGRKSLGRKSLGRTSSIGR